MALAILDHPGFGEAVVFACNAAHCRKVPGGQALADTYWREAAGHAFFRRYEAQEEAPSNPASPNSKGTDLSSDDEEQGYGKANKSKTGGYLKISNLLKDVKLYPLLGISEGASQDEIKKAYRALALKAHPDKLAALDEKEAKEIQENFVKIQEAYELLSDPEKRKLYDSSLDFDDRLPKYKPESGQDFYEVFGECFKRNARWSVRRPVPDIGGPETPMNEVTRFYDFWYGFQTWRDPVAMAQAEGEELEDLDHAECREEKRWMMRENQRIAKKYAKAEKERLTQLASMAEKFDPRIFAEKEAKKAARAAEKARQEEERTAVLRAKQEEERKRKEEEDAKAAAEAELRKQEKAAKEAAKAELKKRRQRLRALHPLVKDFVVLDQLNEVCLQCNMETLEELANSMDASLANEGAEAAAQLAHQAIESLGLKALTPSPDDEISTSEGTSEEAVAETPEQAAERKKKEEEQRKKAEVRRKETEARKKEAEELKKQEAERQAAEAAEKRKIREEQKKKEEAAAEAKRKQAEKKEREKAKKDEEKKKKQEEQEALKREQQREDAKKKAAEQAEKDHQAMLAQEAQNAVEKVQKMFSDDRMERLDAFDKTTAASLTAELEANLEEDRSLRGALGLLKNASLEEEQLHDCLMTLISSVSLVWHLGLEPPKDVKPLESSLRNRAKKARQQLRTVALKFLNDLPSDFGSADKKAASEYQRGMVEGLYEWRVWTVEERMAELEARKAGSPQAAAVEEQPAAEAAAAPAAPAAAAGTGKKGKKGAKQPKEEEDLDALLNEFGVTITEGGKKKKNKK